MLSIEQIQKLIGDPTLTQEQLEQIRDEFHSLAEIVFESYKNQKEKQKSSKSIN